MWGLRLGTACAFLPADACVQMGTSQGLLGDVNVYIRVSACRLGTCVRRSWGFSSTLGCWQEFANKSLTTARVCEIAASSNGSQSLYSWSSPDAGQVVIPWCWACFCKRLCERRWPVQSQGQWREDKNTPENNYRANEFLSPLLNTGSESCDQDQKLKIGG